MKSFTLFLALITSVAFAQGNTGQSTTGVSRGNGLRIPQYRTSGNGAQTYFVDPTGSDSNTCTASGTSACLTIQGAVNKIPKLLRDQVTVSIAAGSYAGAIITGFYVDNGIQQTTGGLLIDGALTNSTLATGSATGTAAGAGQSAGSGSTFGTLCDSGATWTASDLIGRFITTTLPTNTTRVITANTGTCVTIAGTWSLPVAAQTTYAIQDPSVIINTPITGPATPIQASTANRAALIVTGNNLTFSTNSLVLRNVRFSNSTGFGILASGMVGMRIEEVQFRTTSATNSPLAIGGGFVSTAAIAGGGMPSQTSVGFNNVDLSINANLIGVSMSWGLFGATGSLFRNANTNNSAIDGSAPGNNSSLTQFNQNRIVGWGYGIAAPPNSMFGVGSAQFQQNQISCGSTSGAAIVVVNAGVLQIGSPYQPGAANLFGPIVTTAVDTCGTGVAVMGSSVIDITSMSGSVGTTGIDARFGGTVVFAAGGITMTAGTNDINLDSGGVTAAYADVTTGSCVSTAAQGSRACAR